MSAPSLKWADVRRLLSTEVARSQGWTKPSNGAPDLRRASWGTSAQRAEDETCTISIITATDYAEATNEIDPETLLSQSNTVKRATLQLMFESAAGEGGTDDAEDARMWFGREVVRKQLHLAGVSLLREVGQLRKTPYIFEGEWVDAASFDLQIGFQTEYKETTPVDNTAAVNYSGQAGEVAIEPTTVTR